MPVPHFAYIRVWLLTALATICAVCAINLVIDPYGVYGLVRLDGFNNVKVRAQQRGLLSKSYNLVRVGPKSLVLGNSRAEIGFDPDHPGWPADAKPVYNFALPGAGLSSNLQQLDYALRDTQIKTVVLGLDFLDFTFDANKTNLAIRADALRYIAALPTFEWARRAGDYIETLVSLDTLGDSIRTVLEQRNPYATSVTELGFNPLLDYNSLARDLGFRALFDKKNMENARAYIRGGKDIFLPGSQDSPDFDTLRALLARCRKANVGLHLIVYPYHAHTLELFRAAGLWNAFEDWKRRVVQLADEEAVTSGSAQPFSLWDFSGYNPFTIEEVPVPGDLHSEMRWYWEAGHFKKELGDVVLDKVLGYLDSRRGVQNDFGILLTAKNVEAHLSHIRLERDRYAMSHQNELAGLHRLVESSR